MTNQSKIKKLIALPLAAMVLAVGLVSLPEAQAVQAPLPNESQVFGGNTTLIQRFGTVEQIIATLFSIIISIAGVVFVILLFVGGIQYLTSAGNEENTGKAKKLLIDAIIGLIIVLAAWAAGNYVLKVFGLRPGTATSAPGVSRPRPPPAGPGVPLPPPAEEPKRPPPKQGNGAVTSGSPFRDKNYLVNGTLDEQLFLQDCGEALGTLVSSRECFLNGTTYTLQESGDVTPYE